MRNSRKINFVCPNCQGNLKPSRFLIKCRKCKRVFTFKGTIPLLFWPNEWDSKKDVTEIVKSFYEETPFPNYDTIDTLWTLRKKSREAIFARLLDDQIPRDAKVLEVGCGTGQLSNLLGGSWKRQVFATDICLNSLTLGDKFKNKAKIKNTSFVQMNLFKPVFEDESFDVVICNGVLHHTSDPYLGFEKISRLVRPGGFIVIGLYNKYGRIPTDIRRVLFRLTGSKFRFLDPWLRNKNLSEEKKKTWFKDQYVNPWESKHSIDEVLTWFNKNRFEFVNSIPKASFSDTFSEDESVFSKKHEGTVFEHMLIQTGMMLGGAKEGGFFVMIGHKM